MKQPNNNIEELFKSKLRNLEADPGPNAWSNVQSGITSGAASVSASAGASSWVSSAIVGVIITAVAVGGYFLFNNEGEKKIQPQQAEIEKTKTAADIEPSIEKQEKVSTNNEAYNNNAENNAEQSTENQVNRTPAKHDSKENNNSIKSETLSDNEELASVSTEIEEKSIDQMLAEHQQFLDKQAALNSNSDAQTGDDEKESTSTVQPSVAEKTERKSNTNSSDAELTEEARIRAEQKRIADQVVFPNVFSPDLDGKNDVFKMTVEKSIPIENIQVSVVDLNGKVVGGFTGKYEGWDGRLLNGSLAPAGWYKYQAIIYVDGKQVPKIGTFNLKK